MDTLRPFTVHNQPIYEQEYKRSITGHNFKLKIRNTTYLCNLRRDDKCEVHTCSRQPLSLLSLRITLPKFKLDMSEVLCTETSPKYSHFINQLIQLYHSSLQRTRLEYKESEKLLNVQRKGGHTNNYAAPKGNTSL